MLRALLPEHLFVTVTRMPPVPNQTSSARRWVFTLNNWEQSDVDEIAAWEIKYVVFGKEHAPTTNTPHLQGYVIWNNAKRLSGCRRLLRGRAHWEISRGTPEQASEYCKKSGDFVERGVLPGGRNRQSTLERATEWVDGFINDNQRAPTQQEIACLCPPAFFLRDFHLFAQYRAAAAHPPNLREGEPRAWQSALEQELLGEPNDRTIIFCYDQEGASGKTWFQQWFMTKYPETTQMLGVGRVVDMAYMVDVSKSVFFVNVPRGGMEFLQYTILEQLKDRCVTSTKYQSMMKVLHVVPHVVVFCNEEPDHSKLTYDRIDIRTNFEI